MSSLNGYQNLYGHSLALLTDLYQLTMAYGYWKAGMENTEACFYHSYRNAPFRGGYAVFAGLEGLNYFIDQFHFSESDLAFLETIDGNDGSPLFERPFLDYLQRLKFTCDIDAAPEGSVVFPLEPILTVKGPLIQCQLLETAILNLINFPTLIATKAARVRQAAGNDMVIEFGLRRAQGIDGGVTAARAAVIGGCDATSNVLAGKLFDIPVKGTHAHSWVMVFDNEREAFQTYAEHLPNNCIFLVDTYNTLDGVHKAIDTGRWLKEQGYDMVGIRLDSGDLSYLSIEARKLLDDAGFSDAKIVASNELDEHLIRDLKAQGAKISVWGVGTNLVTAKDHPALDGVYKLSAIRHPGEAWKQRLKLSEQSLKISNPGILQVRRFRKGNLFIGDAIYDALTPSEIPWTLIDPADSNRKKEMDPSYTSEDLLTPLYRKGIRVAEPPTLAAIQAHAREQITSLHESIKRFVNPHPYVVGLEKNLFAKKHSHIETLRKEMTHEKCPSDRRSPK